MKNIYFLTLALAIALTACNQNDKQNEADSQDKQSDTTSQSASNSQADDTALYACPMHPEVQGKKNTKCPKCGMKLNEPVSKN